MKNVLLLLITTFLIVACQSTKKEKVEKNVSDEVIIDVSEPIITEIDSIKDEVEEISIEEVTKSQPKIVKIETIKPKEIIEENIPEIEEITTTKDIVEEIKEETIEVTEEEIKEPEIIKNFDHSIWSSFLQKYVSPNGNVNYKAIKANQTELNTYLIQFSKTAPNSTWTKNEKLAYWINAYNAFTIKLIIDNYPTKSIKDIRKPWDKKLANINGKKVSLNYIEHDVLRKMNEPRIHFAINCASVSCPKLLNTAFIPVTLNSQLDAAANDYINSQENRIEKGNVKLSKIFKWFDDDFKKKGNVIDYINQFATTKVNRNEKIKYLDYNWSLNE